MSGGEYISFCAVVVMTKSKLNCLKQYECVAASEVRDPNGSRWCQWDLAALQRLQGESPTSGVPTVLMAFPASPKSKTMRF